MNKRRLGRICFHTFIPLGLILLLLAPLWYWYSSSDFYDMNLYLTWVSKISISLIHFRNVCLELMGKDRSVKEEQKTGGKSRKGIKKQLRDGALYFLSLFAYSLLSLSVKNGRDERSQAQDVSWVSGCLQAERSPGVEACPSLISDVLCVGKKKKTTQQKKAPNKSKPNCLFFFFPPIQNRKELQGNRAAYFFQFALGFPGIFATVHLFKVTLSV